MPTRVRTLRSPLVVLLLAVLGVASAPVTAVSASVSASASASFSASDSASAIASVSGSGHDGSGQDRPGCGRGGQDGLDDPAQPPRPSTSHELLPALHEAHGGSGSWGGDQAVLDLTPVRGPPEPIPLSPFDLSVLRV
ncbi:hypothetical protein [Streptomyces sp. DSM 118878]